MRKASILLLLPATLALTSCGPIVPPLGIKPPADLVADCGQPAKLADDTMGAMADALIANTATLADCRKRHKQLGDWTEGL